jgi:arabinogalactan oligomer / maltooligosaccharide transport system permease protein
MSTLQETAASIPATKTEVKAAKPRRPHLRDTWWRHLVAIVFAVIALFPPLYVLSAAFNRDPSLTGASLIPAHFTWNNFKNLFSSGNSTTDITSNASNFIHWIANTLIAASATAILTVMLGALAAYAFSRFRFKGRRTGMVFLLLVQMFPQILLIVAIYLIVLHVGTVFGFLGLNTLTGLIFVYLGGVLSVNVWFMKGFFDTIPKELDESARVDGATPAQIFWGVVLPLGAPVLAVIGLFSFVATINEFIIASVLLQDDNKKTLAVGMRGFIDQQYSQHWGPFAAGTLIAAIPVVLLFIFLQRFIVEGLTTGSVKG